MPFTAADAIGQSRHILQDREEPYRYTEPELVLILNTAMSEIRRLRPDAFAGTITTLSTPSFYDPDGPDPADGSIPTTDPWPIDEMFFAPVVEYVAAYAELRDDEFVDGAQSSESGRAQLLHQRFIARLLTNSM